MDILVLCVLYEINSTPKEFFVSKKEISSYVP